MWVLKHMGNLDLDGRVLDSDAVMLDLDGTALDSDAVMLDLDGTALDSDVVMLDSDGTALDSNVVMRLIKQQYSAYNPIVKEYILFCLKSYVIG